MSRSWVDRFLGSDPGFNRLRTALMSVLTIALTLEAEWLFVHFTHALQTQTRGAHLTAVAAAKVANANHEFVATVEPLRRNLFGSLDDETSQVMRLAGASRNYSRNLVNDVEAIRPLGGELRRDVERAGATLHESLEVLAEAITGPGQRPYTRSSALFDRTERSLEERADTIDEGQLALRDLKLIDGAMAKMAETLGVRVTDYDTVGPAAT